MIDYEQLQEEIEQELRRGIKEELYQWGLWSKCDGTGKLRDTTSAMWARMPRAANDDEALVITDERAEEIDALMLVLKTGNTEQKQMYEMAWEYFALRYSTRYIASRWNKRNGTGSVSQSTVARRISEVINFVKKN